MATKVEPAKVHEGTKTAHDTPNAKVSTQGREALRQLKASLDTSTAVAARLRGKSSGAA